MLGPEAGPAQAQFDPGATLHRPAMAEVARPTPTGALTEASAQAVDNATTAEEMANELHRVVINLLGSEEAATGTDPREDSAPEEPCLYGSLTSSNRRTLAALKQMQSAINRLGGAYSV